MSSSTAQGTTYCIDSSSRLVSVRFTANLAFSDIVNYATRLRSDPQFEPDFAEVVDLREVVAVDLDSQDLVQLADQVDPFASESRRAFVIRNEAQARTVGLHRMLRLAGIRVRIFTSMDEARSWILEANHLKYSAGER
jgi:hypothetical protein